MDSGAGVVSVFSFLQQSKMNSVDVMFAHVVIGSVGVSGLLVLALCLRRSTSFASNVLFVITSLITALAVACVFASFALGFVWVGSRPHLALTTPSRGETSEICFCLYA